MTLEEGVRAFLLSKAAFAAAFGTRYTPAPLGEQAVLPATTYTVLYDIPAYVHSGAAGWTSARMQLDIWDKTYGGAATNARIIIGLLSGYKGLLGDVRASVFVLNSTPDYEPDTQRHRRIIDLRIHQEG